MQKLKLKIKLYNKAIKSYFEKWSKKNKIKKLYIIIIVLAILGLLTLKINEKTVLKIN